MIAVARIRRLDQVVADAIAAGEVIERPASVVKELIENALDAGATHIDVELSGAGLVSISVVDDGAGISADDLDLAVQRHATSKIATPDDITRVATLGFRGEALASIAAVSDLRLTSRTAGSGSAATLRIRHGVVLERAPAAGPPGTRVEVHELFAATPARLRFLRSVAAESAAAVRVVHELAITRPETSFTCRSDGRVLLRTPGGSLREAVRAIMGARADQHLIDLSAPGAIAVSGAISEPPAHRAGRGGLVLVVNRRRVHNRALLTAVDEAYRGLIPAGRHPYGVVAVDIDPREVDVNVHPAKREVRFSDERGVFAAVQRGCWAALRTVPTPAYHSSTATPTGGLPRISLGVRDGEASPGLYGSGARPEKGAPETATDAAVPSDAGSTMTAIGQAGGEWLVAASGDAVVLVDPHAAHEKILYTELLDRWAKPSADPRGSQLLLIPVIVECSPGAAQAVTADVDFYSSCGFALEAFGPGMVRCTAVPAGAARGDAERLVSDLVDRAGERGNDLGERRHRLAALVACHAAVRFGDRLEPAAQQHLLDRLRVTPGGSTCPHGRPTTLVLDDPMLRRAFRRPPR